MKIKELIVEKVNSKNLVDRNLPSEIDGDFSISEEGLTSLEGSPRRVTDDFFCIDNKLTSLEGGPEYVGGDYHCSGNKLKTLKGAPKTINGDFWCNNNRELQTLEDGPEIIHGSLWCRGNNLRSLKGIHKHIKEINGWFNAVSNPITSHVLGLLLIKNLGKVFLDNKQVETILNKHIGTGMTGMLDAQEELMEAGLEEYAQL